MTRQRSENNDPTDKRDNSMSNLALMNLDKFPASLVGTKELAEHQDDS
jgi:hypothetical protein